MYSVGNATGCGDVPETEKRRPLNRLFKPVAHPVFRRYGFRHEHAFDQDHLVVGLLTAACSNARA
ncbi:hypothetical protein DBIPINDM_004212 [Mesorhizobium sp. AR02]|uniref:hypothetical protein n=1 Tax=Mesorhizobium sp. AR02 TaxID=2865837 RepID=UPI002160A935|nr:hypothetical protein [Mesorhizobium sp. AR02]UVK51006.1 hypothetical protein DBIPINDM_004212 [Mesorhizobium sp. AR02]